MVVLVVLVVVVAVVVKSKDAIQRELAERQGAGVYERRTMPNAQAVDRETSRQHEQGESRGTKLEGSVCLFVVLLRGWRTRVPILESTQCCRRRAKARRASEDKKQGRFCENNAGDVVLGACGERKKEKKEEEEEEETNN